MASVASNTLVGTVRETGNLVVVARSTLVSVRGEELGGHVQVGTRRTRAGGTSLCLRHLSWRGVASVSPLEQEDMRRTLPSVW